MEANKVVSLSPDKTKEAAGVLARVFYTDPLMIYLLPDDQERERKLPNLTEKVARYCHMFNTVNMTAEGKAAACWLPPAQKTERRSGQKPLLFHITWAGQVTEDFSTS